MPLVSAITIIARAEIVLPRRVPPWHAPAMPFRPLIALLALAAAPPLARPEKEVVREQRSVTIGGTKEVWRLIWRGAPKDTGACGVTDPELALTCPCIGFAYGEEGDLVLERQRPGKPSERMRLAPLFADVFDESAAAPPVAMLPRWQTRLQDIGHNPTAATIHARPIVRTIRLRDYNHDGIAGEFLLQVQAGPCGHHGLVAVGVTRADPRLHALATAEHPDRPLVLESWQWAALARNPRPKPLRDVACGDHGSDEETRIVLRTQRGQLHATRVTSTCPDRMNADGEWYHDDHFAPKVLERETL